MITGHVWPFDTVDDLPRYNPDHWPHGFTGGPGIPPKPKLYSTKQTPRGSVVVFGDRIISEHEMSEAIAQQAADWLNHKKRSA